MLLVVCSLWYLFTTACLYSVVVRLLFVVILLLSGCCLFMFSRCLLTSGLQRLGGFYLDDDLPPEMSALHHLEGGRRLLERENLVDKRHYLKREESAKCEQ